MKLTAKIVQGERNSKKTACCFFSIAEPPPVLSKEIARRAQCDTILR